MMFADAENVEPDLIGEFDFFQQMLHALDRGERKARGWVRDGCCETVYADFHVDVSRCVPADWPQPLCHKSSWLASDN